MAKRWGGFAHPSEAEKPGLNSRQDSQSNVALQTMGILQGCAWTRPCPVSQPRPSISSICRGRPVSRGPGGPPRVQQHVLNPN